MAKSRIAPVFVALFLCLFVVSCDEETPVKPGPKPIVETLWIRDVDYIKNKYFYFADPRAFIGPRIVDPQIEVFRAVLPADIVADPSIIFFPGWAIVDSVGDGQSIGEAAVVLDNGGVPANAKLNDFELLTFPADYDFIIDSMSNLTVGIALNDPIPDAALKTLAVRYINQNGESIGGSYSSFGVHGGAGADTLMLKMLKAADPRPVGPFGAVWRLMARNIYNIGFTNIDPNTLRVDIEDNLNLTRLNRETPEGSNVKYLRIFGLDLRDINGDPNPDGLIDLDYQYYLDLATGVLTLPSIDAFAPDSVSVEQWTDDQFAFTGSYEAQWLTSKRIYEERLNPSQEQDVHQYLIRVSVTRPAQ